MPILKKISTHLWLKEVMDIAKTSRPTNLPSAYDSRRAFAVQKGRVDNLLDNQTYTREEVERVKQLKQFFRRLIEESRIPQGEGLLTSLTQSLKQQQTIDRENLQAYYMKLVMSIFERILAPDAKAVWMSNAGEYKILVSLMEFLQTKLKRELGEAVLLVNHTLDFELVPYDKEHYELLDHREIPQSDTSVLVTTGQDQQQLALIAADAKLQVSVLTRELEKQTALCQQQRTEIDALRNALQATHSAIERAREERKIANDELRQTQEALAKANDMIRQLTETEEVSPVKTASPLRTSGHFSPGKRAQDHHAKNQAQQRVL